MKKNLIIWLLLLLLTWLSLLTFKFYTETQKWEDKITISSNCNNWWKKWENKTYWFSLCMPEDWKWMHAIGWIPESIITDDMLEIWEFNKSSEQLINDIQIWPENPNLDSLWYWHWITDFEISWIDNWKMYVDWFKREEWNKLQYIKSILFFEGGDILTRFYYDKNDEVHKKVIDSIKLFF